MSATTTEPSVTRTIELAAGLTVTIQEFGRNTNGTGVLMLHGGAGPRSMTSFAAALSEAGYGSESKSEPESEHAYVIVPTHPGFDGTPRPESTDTVADLASAYLDLLAVLDLRDVTVIGNSVGGWIAAEAGLRDTEGRIARLILLAATGITPEPPLEIANPAVLGPAKTAELAFFRPELRPDPSALTAEQKAAMAANQQTLAVYAGDPFCHDPKLRSRLHRVTVPVLVLAGEQDGIAPLAYERTLAESFPHATFVPISEAGHFPHIDQPEAVSAALGDFIGAALT